MLFWFLCFVSLLLFFVCLVSVFSLGGAVRNLKSGKSLHGCLGRNLFRCPRICVHV